MEEGVDDDLDIIKLLKENVIVEIRSRGVRFTGNEVLKCIADNNEDNK